MRSKDFWLVVLVIILIPFAMAQGTKKLITGGDEMSRGRKYTSLAGLAVLGVFVIVMICVGGSEWLSSRSEVKSTEKMLNTVAEGFANNDRETVLQWAEGGYSDSWGNQFILQHKDGEEGYRMLSKGPDGELGTDDDLSSRVHKPTIKKRVQDVLTIRPKPDEEEKAEPTVEPKPHTPSTLDRAKGWLRKKWEGKDETDGG
jgi:hypothetical protein